MVIPTRIMVSRLLFCHYQHLDLKEADSFLSDFGFQKRAEFDGKIYYAGFGRDPFSYVAEQSSDGRRHFLGGYWALESEQDLQKATAHPRASTVIDMAGPGGGKLVKITDPNGFIVGLVWGQKESATTSDITRDKEDRSGSAPVPNSAFKKPRQGKFRRFEAGACPVHKLGHYGYIVPQSKWDETYEWYLTTLNLKPADAVYDPRTGRDRTVFLHIDLGHEYTDHHSFFLGAGPDDKAAHVHHSSYEVNDFDTQSLGHDWLEKRGWKNCWGIGRHVLGSQIFDYWFDASGNVVEHYTDGDLVNEDTPFERSPEAPDSLFIWGPNIPLAFVTGDVKDVGKLLLPTPPSSAPAVAA